MCGGVSLEKQSLACEANVSLAIKALILEYSLSDYFACTLRLVTEPASDAFKHSRGVRPRREAKSCRKVQSSCLGYAAGR